MAEQTNIEWADSTFNPWIGCTKISPACDNCYAENLMDTRMHRVEWGAGKPRQRTSAANWKKPIQWNRNAAGFVQCKDCGQRGDVVEMGCAGCGSKNLAPARRRVFFASLADVLDNEVPIEWLVDLLDLIQRTPHLDWLALTKRIGNWRSRLEAAARHLENEMSERSADGDLSMWMADWLRDNAPVNVWLGITVVNQEEADRDIPKLLQVPAAVRFLSIEPMLGPVELEDCWFGDYESCDGYLPRQLSWVIVGGESGANARPMHPDWIRSLRDQCKAAGTPFLFKQWGEWGSGAIICSTGEPVFREFTSLQHWVNKASTWVQGGICLDRGGNQLRNGGDMKAAFEDGRFPVTIMHKVGKKFAGNILDGRKHLEWPK